MEQTSPHAQTHSERVTDPSLAEDLRLLAEEAKVLARTEVAFQKGRARYAGQQMKSIVALLIVALVLVFFALMALVVGLVIALGPVLGAWGAMASVTLGLLVLAALGAAIAKSRFSKMKAVISNDRPARKDLLA